MILHLFYILLPCLASLNACLLCSPHVVTVESHPPSRCIFYTLLVGVRLWSYIYAPSSFVFLSPCSRNPPFFLILHYIL
ncbi:hypothetical protein BDZ94DRAFT_1262164, partial [Collybia nuda]